MATYPHRQPQRDVHRSLELLEEFHADLFRSSDRELKRELEGVISQFKSGLFNALCDIHEFYERTLLNERLTQTEKVYEARRLANQLLSLSTSTTTTAPVSSSSYASETFGGVRRATTTTTVTSGGHLKDFGASYAPAPTIRLQPATPRIIPTSTISSQQQHHQPIRVPQQVRPSSRNVIISRPSSALAYAPPPAASSRPPSERGFLITAPVNRVVDELGREWEVEEVLLDVSSTGLGFSIIGGLDRPKEPDHHIRVTSIEQGGAVARDGRIRIGDVLLRVNDVDCFAVEHEVAVSALKTAVEGGDHFVRLLLKRLKPMQRSLSQTHLTTATGGNGPSPHTTASSTQRTVVAFQQQPQQQAALVNGNRSQSWQQLSSSNNAHQPAPPMITSTSSQHPLLPPIGSRRAGTLPRQSAIVRAGPILPQPQPAPRVVQIRPGLEPRQVSVRKSDTHGLGFNIVGGEGGEPLYVSFVQPGGPADLSGQVFVGDVLMWVDGTDLRRATHSQAAAALRGVQPGAVVSMTVQHRPDDFYRFEELVERHNRELTRQLAASQSQQQQQQR